MLYLNRGLLWNQLNIFKALASPVRFIQIPLIFTCRSCIGNTIPPIVDRDSIISSSNTTNLWNWWLRKKLVDFLIFEKTKEKLFFLLENHSVGEFTMSTYSNSFFYEMGVLSKRNTKNILRNPIVLFGRLVQTSKNIGFLMGKKSKI